MCELPQVTQLVSNGAGIWPWSVEPQAYFLDSYDGHSKKGMKASDKNMVI